MRCITQNSLNGTLGFLWDVGLSLFATCDEQLFSKINCNSLHILQQFVPERTSLSYSLRPRSLITKSTQLNDHNFLIKSIYKDSYWLYPSNGICLYLTVIIAYIHLYILALFVNCHLTRNDCVFNRTCSTPIAYGSYSALGPDFRKILWRIYDYKIVIT